MEIVFAFIRDHWIVVLWLVLEVIFGVLVLLKKSKSNEPLYAVIAALPRFIIYAENKFGAGHGVEKKAHVLGNAVKLFYEFTGIELSSNSGLFKILDQKIEEILKTPVKKEDK